MSAWPDAPAVARYLASVRQRLTTAALLRGAASGLLASIGLAVAGTVMGWPVAATRAAMLGLVAAGVAAALVRTRRHRAAPAAEIERRAPECRNVLVTAAEIIARPRTVRDDIGARICRDAARHAARLAVSRVLPIRAALVLFAAAAAAAGGAAASLSSPAITDRLIAPVSPDSADLGRIEITVTPPSYTQRAAETLDDPDRVVAIAGSRIDIRIAARAARVALETIQARTDLAESAPRVFTGGLVADRDGFLAVQPMSANGTAGERRLIGLTVTPDRAPAVEITKPGRDLLLPQGAGSIELGVAANDDLGLASLHVSYTKVTGSGENFAFATGTVPIAVTRADDRAWTGRGTWAIGPLALEPGDMVVYRAVAADHRPGAAPVESDAFIVEIVAPGSVAAEGFVVDDQTERYALSQRMVILKTERLIARRTSMTPEAFADEAMSIAAEQRQVRAEFIFMMGGALDHEHTEEEGSESIGEEAEAAGEAELLAGRLRNQGRTELLTATRRMSEAAIALNVPDTKTALEAERAALALLQRAFSKNRFLLRALTVRERLDETRRLTGAITEVAPDARRAGEPDANARLDALRQVLAGVTTLAARAPLTTADAGEATALAEAVIRVDATSPDARGVAAALTSAAAAIARGAGDAPAHLARAAVAVAALVRAELPAAPARSPDAAAGRLRSAVGGGGR